ncbi:Protein NLRC5 [Holothuria leucospilota]|uniref:Protein NLRC5 n=1 Tax=Holothuria leucospilota TaxID=206669 RepID=A0A9Q1HM04_HOLLE|nr:Protein NLRC5 [Holothuria leucospilota]
MADFSNDISINPPEAVLTDTSKAKQDFGLFLREVSSLLPFITVKEIAPFFRYSTEEIGEYEHQENPGYVFISSLNQKHIIHPGDISKLTNALKIVDMHDVAQEVSVVFRRNREKAKVIVLKKIFIEELKKTYRDVHNNLKPMPFKPEKRFLVDQLFIDRGIYLITKEGIRTSRQKLESYHDMFDESKITSTRIILSSKAGYGKSTLALKLASDWANKCKDSPLADVEILIFLRLRQFDSSISICKAIQKYLLSDESELNESDVEKILFDSQSVVMVLEGFDKYVHKGKHEDDDVISILKGRMFPNFRVILTTTPSCKPGFMNPTTAEVTLEGFDLEARNEYIRKALLTDDEEMFTKVTQHINENLVMRDLCEIPFVFAMVLNLIQEEEEGERIPFWFISITGFVRYVIGSICEHKKEKMRKADRKKYDKFKDDHEKLDKVCFKHLSEGVEVTKWISDDLQKIIGKDLYDYYIAVEILVQEEEFVVDTSPHAATSSLIVRKTYARMRYKLLMQWFAAHHIAKRATKFFKGYSDSDLKKLLDKNLHYVFLFTCGINPHATSNIVDFLIRQRPDNCEQLVNLCKQEEKLGH